MVANLCFLLIILTGSVVRTGAVAGGETPDKPETRLPEVREREDLSREGSDYTKQFGKRIRSGADSGLPRPFPNTQSHVHLFGNLLGSFPEGTFEGPGIDMNVGQSSPPSHVYYCEKVMPSSSPSIYSTGSVRFVPRQYPHYPQQFAPHWVPYQTVSDYGRPVIDPYLLELLQRYLRHIPQSFYGTNLPKYKPPGVFQYYDKDK